MPKLDIEAQYVAPIFEHLKSGNTEEDLHIKTAPEGITADSIKLHQTHDLNFVAGTARAVGRLAKERFSGDSSLESDTHTLGMSGKNSVTVTANKDGSMDISVTNRAADAGAGELKKAVREFKDAVQEAMTE